MVSQPVSKERSRELFGDYTERMRGPKRWVDLWSAGHTVSAVDSVLGTAQLIDAIEREYQQGREDTRRLMAAL